MLSQAVFRKINNKNTPKQRFSSLNRNANDKESTATATTTTTAPTKQIKVRKKHKKDQ